MEEKGFVFLMDRRGQGKSSFVKKKLNEAFNSDELSELPVFLSTDVHTLLQHSAVEELMLLAR